MPLTRAQLAAKKMFDSRNRAAEEAEEAAELVPGCSDNGQPDNPVVVCRPPSRLLSPCAYVPRFGTTKHVTFADNSDDEDKCSQLTEPCGINEDAASSEDAKA
jgi:hypothetical protein